MVEANGEDFRKRRKRTRWPAAAHTPRSGPTYFRLHGYLPSASQPRQKPRPRYLPAQSPYQSGLEAWRRRPTTRAVKAATGDAVVAVGTAMEQEEVARKGIENGSALPSPTIFSSLERLGVTSEAMRPQRLTPVLSPLLFPETCHFPCTP